MAPETLMDVLDGEDMPLSVGMSDYELCAAVDKESRQALGYADEIASERRRALEFYLGEAKGELAPPEIQGRSKVVSKDLMDTIEWIMPSMMRLFSGTDQVARFEPDTPQDEQGAKDATHYCAHVLMEQNPGFTILHDAIKNSLIQRMAIVKVHVDDAWDEREEVYQGVDELSFEALSGDEQVEVVSAEPDAMGLLTVKVKRREQIKKYVIEGVPPEEFGMNSDARTVEDARFVEHRVRRTVSELKSMGYDPDIVDRLFTEDEPDEYGEEDERRSLEGGWKGRDDPADPSQRQVWLHEAYLRIDFDGDGIAEYRRVVKAGNVILENDVTDDHPFCLFTPILLPYRAIGLGYYDLVEDLQRIRTAVTRQALDNLYLANTPVTEIVEGQVNMDDLLNPRPGGFVRVKAAGQMNQLTTPFIGPNALVMLDHFGKVRDARTGVTEFNQGLQGKELAGSNVGSQGVENLMNSAMQRVELMARVFSEGPIKRLFRLILKQVTQHADRPQEMKVNGRWMTVNPREWKTQYRLSVSVGVGTASRQAQIANLQAILALQEKAGMIGLATPENAYNALGRLVEQMGYRDPDQFFTAPPEGPQEPEEPEQSPEAMALVQAEQIKAQASLQKQQMADANAIEIERMRIASDETIKKAEILAKTQLELMKAGVIPIPQAYLQTP